MRNRRFGIVSALTLRERVVLAAGGATFLAAAFLSAIGDVSLLVPIAIACLYGMVVFGTWTAAGRRQSNTFGAEGRYEKRSMQPALSVAYWSFFMILLGFVMAWAAVFQLLNRGGSAFSFVLLTIGVALIGVSVFALANIWRHQGK